MSPPRGRWGCALAALALASCAHAGGFSAGVARQSITPDGPIRMSGYASRTKPSEGVAHDLWAKALALQDPEGGRVVIVTADLIGLPREVCEAAAARLRDRHGLERSQIVFTASHTHYGPIVWPNLKSMYDLPAEERERVVEYGRRLVDVLVAVVDEALKDLSPAAISIGHGKAGFAVNRRQRTEKGYRLGVDPEGPVDHDVPVLRVASPDGRVRAVLFGYACHNTTVSPNDYRICGDYAGFAQAELEKTLPGAAALFVMLCGADQNPNPRGKMEQSVEYGQALAGEVRRVLDGPLVSVRPSIRTAYGEGTLEFAPQDRAVFEKEAASADRHRQRRGRAMMEAIDAGRPVRNTTCPVQVVRLGGTVAIVAMGGEVVVDYALRLKRETPGTDLIAVSYANDVPCYIPSRRVLLEGGYEPVDSMVYYGWPGPFTEEVEETFLRTCRGLLERTASAPAR